MEASVFIATSVDGFIARENGSVDWLSSAEAVENEDYGFHDFMNSVDVLVMGHNTFEMVLSFDSWSYGDKPVIILSNHEIEIPENISSKVSRMSGTPHEIVDRLAKQGFEHLYVDGGKTIQGFLSAGLIQNLIITRIPILLGSGIPLFGKLPHDIKLEHLETKYFTNGLIQSKYRIQ